MKFLFEITFLDEFFGPFIVDSKNFFIEDHYNCIDFVFPLNEYKVFKLCEYISKNNFVFYAKIVLKGMEENHMNFVLHDAWPVSVDYSNDEAVIKFYFKSCENSSEFAAAINNFPRNVMETILRLFL